MGEQLNLFGNDTTFVVTAGDPSAHNYFAVGSGRDFVVFNDGPLADEEVTADDVVPVEIERGTRFESWAWSANCSWYFVFCDAGVMLFNTYTGRGLLCRKRSWRFIEMYLEARLPRSCRERGGRGARG